MSGPKVWKRVGSKVHLKEDGVGAALRCICGYVSSRGASTAGGEALAPQPPHQRGLLGRETIVTRGSSSAMYEGLQLRSQTPPPLSASLSADQAALYSAVPIQWLQKFPELYSDVHAPGLPMGAEAASARIASSTIRSLIKILRMGSFNSAPKIMNEDTHDNKLQIPDSMTRNELLDFCYKGNTSSTQLIKRTFQHKEDNTISDQLKLISLGDQAVTPCKPNNIRVLQWNVLSQTLGQTNDNFVLCPNEALMWDHRKYNIIEEIVQYNPDVICLQEVDHFNFLKKILKTQGFDGVFYPKPDSPCMYIEGNNGPDGCAIFYNKDKYECLHTDAKILEVWKVQSNQVAVVAVLRSKQTGEEVCVATTHLKARNGALLSKLRNEQGKDLLEFIQSKSDQRPVILCGDFNAEPSEPVYRTVLGNKNLELGSAYANFALLENNENPTIQPDESQANEVPYTTWKVREEGEVCHTIDYIFYSHKYFKIDGVLRIPSGEDVGEARVPSYSYPSDHFSLMCDFSLKPTN